MTELILLRHGETDWNRELRFQGQVDVSLNPVGFEQAERLAARLAGQRFQSLVASDLLRARQTAEPVSRTLALPPTIEAGLREQGFGEIDGMRVEDIQAQHPEIWQAWLRFDADYAMPGGGESTRQFHARVMDAVRRLVAQWSGQRLVLVTHGGVLDMVFRTATGQDLSGPRQADIPNAGYNRVRVRDTGIDLLDWADTSHLAGMPPQPVYDQKRHVKTEPSPSEA